MFFIVVPKKYKTVQEALMAATKLMVEAGLEKEDLVVVDSEGLASMEVDGVSQESLH
jgi:hypothetical protein